MASLSWLSRKVKRLWNLRKSNSRWWEILQRGWPSHLPFHAKVSIWRVMIGGLPLGSTLKRRGLGSGTRFFCIIPLEDNTHRLIKCSITCISWKHLSNIWQVLNPLLFEASTMSFLLLYSKWSKRRAEDIVPVFTISGIVTQLEYV